MNELTKRILFAVPAAVIFLYLTWLGGVFFIILILATSLFVQHELLVMVENAGFDVGHTMPYLIGLWLLLSPFLPHPVLFGLILFLAYVCTEIVKPGARGIKELVTTLFCGIYTPVGFWALLMVRNFGDQQLGFIFTITLLLMVWGNDILAYFGGKAFGRRPLAPRLSPNKTWEGLMFGILGALLGLVIPMLLLPYHYPVSIVVMLPLVILIGIFGPVGDLTESRIKRAAQVKDASDLLPGHGGVYDRFDALILAAPAFYVYLSLLQILGYVSF